MKNKILGLRTVIYKVPDLPKAKAWYTSVFGVNPYFDEPFYVGYTIGGYELGLQPEDKAITERPDNAVAYWGVDNMEAEYARFLKEGASAQEAPQHVGGEIVVATVRDPWGNVIGLIYNPHFKAG